MSNEKIYDLLEKMYIEFTGRFEKLETRMDGLDNRMDKLEIRMENEVIDTIQILLDGHQLHTEQLNRIENKVSTHEEIIFKRIK